jgi:hypothetical protein
LSEAIDEQLLRRLDALTAADAAYYSSPRNQDSENEVTKNQATWCLPGTRVKLRREILDWAIGNTDEAASISCIEGMAGTGKSTLARSIAEHVKDAGHIVMSFFFDRDVKDRKDVKKLAGTLARQLADVSTVLKRSVSDAFKKDHDISNRSPEDQWKRLIIGPLKDLSESLKNPKEHTDSGLQPENSRPIVFLVIDALDECSAQGVQILGSALGSIKSISSVSFRVLITSRFRHTQVPLDKLGIERYQLEERPEDEVRSDLEILYATELQSIWKDYLTQRKLLDGYPVSDSNVASWPTQEDIRRLIDKAGGLFQYAAVACRIIRGSIVSPVQQLKDILEAPSDGLDGMYRMALKNTIHSDDDQEVFFRKFQLVFGALLLSPDPLSKTSLTGLLGDKKLPPEDISSFLARFDSVLHVPHKETLAIRVIHLSFRDFMLDDQRNKDSRFQIDQLEIHTRLFQRSLDMMMSSTQGLKRNIAGLKSPGTCIVDVKTGMPHDVDEEDEIVERHSNLNIRPELQYACRFWADHLRQIKDKRELLHSVLKFLEEHFLHWLEALGLMAKINEGILTISSLKSIFEVSNNSNRFKEAPTNILLRPTKVTICISLSTMQNDLPYITDQ